MRLVNETYQFFDSSTDVSHCAVTIRDKIGSGQYLAEDLRNAIRIIVQHLKAGSWKTTVSTPHTESVSEMHSYPSDEVLLPRWKLLHLTNSSYLSASLFGHALRQSCCLFNFYPEVLFRALGLNRTSSCRQHRIVGWREEGRTGSNFLHWFASSVTAGWRTSGAESVTPPGQVSRVDSGKCPSVKPDRIEP